MPAAPLPPNEDQRLDRLFSYDILDTVSEREYDDIVRIASKICRTPIALVSLIDQKRQWFKARIGVHVIETHRDAAFCAYAILEHDKVMQVPDATLDDRFKDNVLVNGEPHIRFYAGAPLVSPDGMPLGTLCVIDTEPRELTEDQVAALQSLGRQVSALLELRFEKKQSDRFLKELQRSNRDLMEFANAATHDLKEPLRGIEVLTVLLTQDLGDSIDDESLERLHSIGKSSHRLQKLIERLMHYCEVGRSLEKQPQVDFNEAVAQAIERLDTCIAENQVEITHEPLPRVAADPILLVEVFQNLISNAIKYNEQATKRIQIGSADVIDPESGDSVVAYFVADNGIGIGPRCRDAIFNIFRRLHSENDYGGGTGTGLTIVRKVVQLHGGKIWVDSLDDGRTCFWFTMADR